VKGCINISHTHTHVYTYVFCCIYNMSNYTEEDEFRSHCMWSKCMYIMQIRCVNQKLFLSTFTDDGGCRFTRFVFELVVESQTNPV